MVMAYVSRGLFRRGRRGRGDGVSQGSPLAPTVPTFSPTVLTHRAGGLPFPDCTKVGPIPAVWRATGGKIAGGNASPRKGARTCRELSSLEGGPVGMRRPLSELSWGHLSHSSMRMGWVAPASLLTVFHRRP